MNLKLCPVHRTEMKPLFSSWFCPSCDDENNAAYRAYIHTQEQPIFSELSPKEQRIWLATDVLLQIKKNKIKPQTGSFIGYITRTEDGQEDYCQACALGSLMLSHYAKDASEVKSIITEDADVARTRIHKQLSPYFSSVQLDLIETAFERTDSYRVSATKQELQRALEWSYSKYKDSSRETVLIAIMNNIIDNDGIFIP